MRESQLRASYERLLAARAASGDRTRCPSLDQLQALLDRDGPEAGRIGHLDHVMGCPFCREEFDLLHAVRGAGLRRAPAFGTLALAASLLLVVGAALFWRLGSRADDTPRGVPGPVVLLAPADGASLSVSPLFIWHAVPDARRYHVELLRPDGVVVWSAEGRDTAGAVPAATSLEPGAEYRWRVEAEMPDGERRASGMRRFSVRAP